MRGSKLAGAVVLLALSAAVGCDGCSSDPCHDKGTACGSNSDCCSNLQCNGGVCGDPCIADGQTCAAGSDCCSFAGGGGCLGSPPTCVSQCTGKIPGDSCSDASECCTHKCENGICIDDPCTALTGGCTANNDCCNGLCDPASSKCGGGTCHPAGGQCSSNLECCSGTTCSGGSCVACGQEGASCTSDAQCCPGIARCKLETGTCVQTDCIPGGEACVQGASCCGGLQCSGGTCPSGECVTSGTASANACASGEQCCSRNCSGGYCAKVPGPGGACTTLYEPCAGDSECCSTNCAGPDGDKRCLPSYWCNASGDICFGPDDCCSHLCAATSGSPSQTNPGRCQEPTGSGCTQDGNPCDNDSNCCTRRCRDLGTGVKVCQVAPGCTMTGDYCTSTQACCGGAGPSTDPTGPNTYGVYCDIPVGKHPDRPYYDTGTHDGSVCTAGTSCNPPGNICNDSASQNCCHEGNGPGTPFCWADEVGIMRCHMDCGPDCAKGCNGVDPACCQNPNDLCTTPQDCCEYSPCVPDQDGILRCMCLPPGSICSHDPAPSPGTIGTVHQYTPPDMDPCCAGTQCTWIGGEIGWACQSGQCTKLAGETCTSSTECCEGTCLDGTCTICKSDGTACTLDSQCCSGSCDATGHCKSCVPDGSDCTADSDCCSLMCDYFTGKCSPGDCARTNASCLVYPCCPGTGQTCVDGWCVTPPTCPGDGYACSTSDPCCSNVSPELRCHETSSGAPAACTSTSTNCFCEACAAQGESCSPTYGCCSASQSYCANPVTAQPCAGSDTGCFCKSVNG